jgi:hypothetical protein
MKKSLFLILVLSSQVAAQPVLTKDEMREDLIFLVQKIKNVSPHLEIRRQVTGTDVLKEIDRLAESEIASFEDFYYTAKRILLLCQDQHNDLSSYPEWIDEINPNITSDAKRISDSCENVYDKYHSVNCTSVEYTGGKYFFYYTLYDHSDKVLIPAGAELIKVYGIDINDYVHRFNRHIDHSVRWDFELKKYYTRRIFPPDMTGLNTNDMSLTYRFDGIEKTVQQTGGIIKTIHDFDPGVSYFHKHNILYLRIPAMDAEQCDFFVNEIMKHREEKIKKIIIDLRGNGGGNDRLWRTVLSAIVAEPLTMSEKYYIRDTYDAREYLTGIRKFPLNKDDTMSINGINYIGLSGDKDTIVPADKTLNYRGAVYLPVNNKCFSSTLAFTSSCREVASFVTVGEPSGYIGGKGLSPFFFRMPNSQLIFSIIPVLDASNVKSIEDYYDSQVNIPVKLNIDDYIFDRDDQSKRYGEDYLFNHDPVFRKILELP